MDREGKEVSVQPTLDRIAKLWEIGWRYLLIPLAYGLFYVATAYTDSHYVSKQYFDSSMGTLADDKYRYAEEQKAGFKELSVKLDALLLRDSANAQRFLDYDRRLNNVESKVDRLQERK